MYANVFEVSFAHVALRDAQREDKQSLSMINIMSRNDLHDEAYSSDKDN